MTDATCSIEGCERKVRARSWCSTHYARWRRYGRVDLLPELTPVERFWAKVDKGGEGGCWLWTGATSVGYGRFNLDDRLGMAHRISYELLIGPIPDGLHLDHLCRVTTCVNPAHLEPVTCRENIVRGVGPSAANAVKTHCIHGHEFTPENTHVRSRGARECRTCMRERDRRRDERLRSAN